MRAGILLLGINFLWVYAGSIDFIGRIMLVVTMIFAIGLDCLEFLYFLDRLDKHAPLKSK